VRGNRHLPNVCKAAQLAPASKCLPCSFRYLWLALALLRPRFMHPEEMVSRYEAVLYARAMRLVRSRSDALDLLQDTYERALRGRASFQPGTNLRHWLMTI